MRKAVKIGFIGVFCAVIGLAFPVFNIFSKQLSMDSHENRLMTGLPQVLQSPLRELPRNLDNFLVDNSPFRYQFVLVNAGLDYALFGTSQSDQVLPGKDGLVHISKLANERVEKVEDVVNIGDKIMVKVIEIDDKGRVNLTRKGLIPEKEEKK